MNLQSIGKWYWWIASLFVAIITSFIIFLNSIENLPQGKELIWYGIDGVLMKIPQRLMMQSFVWYVLEKFGTKDAVYISIPITALIWCVSIIIQNLICKIHFSIKTVRELIASAFFSISVGYILVESNFIFFTMITHFFERIISTILRKNQTRIIKTRKGR